jgi:hypothetical protein
MTHSTSRGLLYTAPPTEDDERAESAERTELAAERTESTAAESNRGHAAADD